LNVYKIILSILLVLPLVFTMHFVVSAHSASSCDSGSESRGWKVHCSNSSNGHIGIYSFDFKYSPNLSSSYKNITNQGKSRWNTVGAVNINYSSNSNNIVSQYSDPNTSTIAHVQSNTFNNHKTRWQLSYNDSKMDSRTDSKNIATSAHEFGHTIGLADLIQSSNEGKLMYGYSSRTVGYPQLSDITGAEEGVK